MKRDQWPKYIADVYRILKPGNGWAQFGETEPARWDDDSVPEDSPYARVPTLNYAVLIIVSALSERILGKSTGTP